LGAPGFQPNGLACVFSIRPFLRIVSFLKDCNKVFARLFPSDVVSSRGSLESPNTIRLTFFLAPLALARKSEIFLRELIVSDRDLNVLVVFLLPFFCCNKAFFPHSPDHVALGFPPSPRSLFSVACPLLSCTTLSLGRPPSLIKLASCRVAPTPSTSFFGLSASLITTPVAVLPWPISPTLSFSPSR